MRSADRAGEEAQHSLLVVRGIDAVAAEMAGAGHAEQQLRPSRRPIDIGTLVRRDHLSVVPTMARSGLCRRAASISGRTAAS